MTAGRTAVGQSVHWGTPQKIIDSVREIFGEIDLDPCSNEWSLVNAKTSFKLPDQDGLVLPWQYQNIYVNPPYGFDKARGTRISDWFKKCYEANRDYGSKVIALVPVSSNTSHWKYYVWNKATQICFLYDTRLKFLENGVVSKKGAPMSCCVIQWGCDKARFRKELSKHGFVVDIECLSGISEVERSTDLNEVHHETE